MRNTDQSRRMRRAGRSAALALAGLSLASLLAARGVAAQPPGPPPGGQPGMGGPGGGPGRMQAMLFEGITLEAAQQTRVDSINGVYRERMMAQRQSAPAGTPDSAAMAARRATMQEHRAALRAVLNAEQQKTFDANVQRMEQRMRERGGGPGRPPGGQR